MPKIRFNPISDRLSTRVIAERIISAVAMEPWVSIAPKGDGVLQSAWGPAEAAGPSHKHT